MDNFLKQKRFVILKLNQILKKSTKESAELAKSAARFTDTKKSFAKANWDCIYPNFPKFGPTNTKLEG